MVTAKKLVKKVVVSKVAPKKAPLDYSKMKVAMGLEVKDLLTGVTGILFYRCHRLGGVVHWAVQPMGDGKKSEDAMTYDEQLLVVTGPGLFDKVTPLPKDIGMKLGDAVADKASTFQGVVTEIIYHINGCVSVGVTPPSSESAFGDRVPTQSMLDYRRLDVLKSEVIAPIKAPKGVEEGTVLPTGPKHERVGREKAVRM